ncbi:hypothetical protein B296_00004753 [Ensete ventricosum]|uniref:Uncharacterized protein n=1 Tax=Ensete ventricosum TaxID=4639 RepID=A0A426X181_ENSVE|nr:hypothetical protein B296_00004753 [Ensete ventricosum]
MAWLPTRGGRLRPGMHVVATRKGRPARKGLPPASRGGGAGRRGGRPLAGQLLVAKGSRRLRRGSSGGDAVRVKEG